MIIMLMTPCGCHALGALSAELRTRMRLCMFASFVSIRSPLILQQPHYLSTRVLALTLRLPPKPPRKHANAGGDSAQSPKSTPFALLGRTRKERPQPAHRARGVSSRSTISSRLLGPSAFSLKTQVCFVLWTTGVHDSVSSKRLRLCGSLFLQATHSPWGAVTPAGTLKAQGRRVGKGPV